MSVRCDCLTLNLGFGLDHDVHHPHTREERHRLVGAEVMQFFMKVERNTRRAVCVGACVRGLQRLQHLSGAVRGIVAV